MRWRDWALGFAVAAVAGQLAAGLWWHTLRFPRFAFFDNGWPLTADALLDAGAVPTRDFAYTYGLTSLLANRAAFTLFGATPHVASALVLAGGLLSVAGVWRLTVALRLGGLAAVAAVVVTPLLLPLIDIPSPTHALEAALLTHALAEQSRGKPGRALALAAVAVTVKPALGYIYGLVLVVQIVATADPAGWHRLRRLLPAVVVGVATLAGLVAAFGLEAVWRTQLPGAARAEYDDLGCGFFAELGRPFWLPAYLGNWEYVAESPFGVWAVGTLLLLLGAAAGLRRTRTDPAAVVLLALAVWQVTFVLTAFGNGGAWVYYPYVPFVGGAVALDRLPAWLGRRIGRPLAVAFGAAFLALAAQPAWRYLGLSLQPRPAEWAREAGTGALYLFPDEAAAWRRVRALAAGGEPVYALYRMGATPILFPEIGGPKSWYLSQPLATPSEREAVRRGLAKARWLVVSTYMTHTLPDWATAAADGFDLDEPPAFTSSPIPTPTFRVYRRVRP